MANDEPAAFQPEGPSSPREKQARPRRDYPYAAEREIEDLKSQRQRAEGQYLALQAELAAQRQVERELHVALTAARVQNASLIVGQSVSNRVVGVGAIAAAAGGTLLALDSSRCVVFGIGIGVFLIGMILQMLGYFDLLAKKQTDAEPSVPPPSWSK